ncbi:hypothetical protein FA13DRAFT_9 [Coprinellus micaceus]|uniref:Uncharacterized protein n=1 Tax=Coprinellus micaceus TaxID=71717 RepID=A0A4Y7TZE4_COPMI|nr:hypothetical protein FA13DRAFT_9 [Coprinellus micaceus]
MRCMSRSIPIHPGSSPTRVSMPSLLSFFSCSFWSVWRPVVWSENHHSHCSFPATAHLGRYRSNSTPAASPHIPSPAD